MKRGSIFSLLIFQNFKQKKKKSSSFIYKLHSRKSNAKILSKIYFVSTCLKHISIISNQTSLLFSSLLGPLFWKEFFLNPKIMLLAIFTTKLLQCPVVVPAPCFFLFSFRSSDPKLVLDGDRYEARSHTQIPRPSIDSPVVRERSSRWLRNKVGYSEIVFGRSMSRCRRDFQLSRASD